MMGDEAYHATSAVDYRSNKEYRMAATIYIADVNEQNVDSIMSNYTQAYPPQDQDMLLGWSARHWKKNDPSRKLPTPADTHVLKKQTKSTEPHQGRYTELYACMIGGPKYSTQDALNT